MLKKGKRVVFKSQWIFAALLALLVAVLGGEAVWAEPVLDRALSGASVIEGKNCSVIRLGFNFRVRYQNHFPSNNGRELRIIVRPIDRGIAADQIRVKREAMRPPKLRQAAIRAIELEVGRADGLTLFVQFAKSRHYKVAQGTDFSSIVVAVSGSSPSSNCRPEFVAGADPKSWSTKTSQAKPTKLKRFKKKKKRAKRDLTAAETKNVDKAMAGAQKALTNKKYRRAIQLLTKVLSFPENKHSQNAQELLGLARDRNGQSAHAKAEYQAYLEHYPNGDAAQRVRQRLQTLTTAHDSRKAPLRKAKSASSAKGRAGTTQDGTHWSISGSLSQFYYRDGSQRTVKDPSLPPDPNEDPDKFETHQNELLSSIDLFARWGNSQHQSKIRFAGTKTNDFMEDSKHDDQDFSIATLYAETELKDWHVLARVGRQTRNTGGVVGRFDGGLLSYQINDTLKLNGVVGKPVDSRKDPLFEDERFFYGLSLDIGPFNGLDISLSALQQEIDGIIDRQSLGTEIRYFDTHRSIFALFDYDLHFNELNAGIINTSWKFSDKSTLTLAADYRKSPFLSTRNALYSQPLDSVRSLLGVYSEDEIYRFAEDRTATSRSATLGYTRPISEALQVNFDVTWSNVSGTNASGGVEATPSTGDEFFYSTQIIGSNIIKNGDIFLAGFRYADRANTDYFVLDLNSRYPLTPDWRLNPRLRFSYRENKFDDYEEFAVLPSLTVDYRWTKYLNIEAEVGARISTWEQGTATGRDQDFFFIFGYRYDLFADGEGRRDGLDWLGK